MNKFFLKENRPTIGLIISNPFILGIFPAILLFILLPNIQEKFILNIEQKRNRTDNSLLFFLHDIDNDGRQDRLDISNYYGEFACCKAYYDKTNIALQYNFYGLLPAQRKANEPIFIDTNNDNKDEVFIFTQKADSIFLNAFEFGHADREEILLGRFITTIGLQNGKTDYALSHLGNFDKNNDSVPEIYFSIAGGYSLYPRKIFCYDFIHDELSTSINTGSSQYLGNFCDETGNITMLGNATNNCTKDFPFQYSDTSNWLFAYDKDLNFRFSPIQFPGSISTFRGLIKYENELHVFYEELKDSILLKQLIILDENGKTIEKKELPNFRSSIPLNINHNDHSHYFLTDWTMPKKIAYEYFPDERKLSITKQSKSIKHLSLTPIDIDLTKDNDFLGYNHITSSLELLLDDFDQEIVIESQEGNLMWDYIQTQHTQDGELIYMANNNFLYTFFLQKNQGYTLRYLWLLFLYLPSSGFMFLAQYFQKQQIKRRDKLQNQIATLQLQLVNSQLDPHFTFNTLNSISSKILQGEKFAAYDLMNSFSRMMRSAMLFSNKDSWSLGEELRFVKDYLGLMKERFKEHFIFTIQKEIPDPVYSTVIPRLLIMNFAENALKHAFTEIDYVGTIDIKIAVKNQMLDIIVEDNGIGIDKATQTKSPSINKSGKGLILIKQQIQIFNKINNQNIQFNIGNHVNDKPGTCIHIQMPIKQKIRQA